MHMTEVGIYQLVECIFLIVSGIIKEELWNYHLNIYCNLRITGKNRQFFVFFIYIYSTFGDNYSLQCKTNF